MTKSFRKTDGVLEAVRTSENGNIESVRLFLRRGPVWSDRLIIDRSSLIKLLQNRKKLFTGKRIPKQGSEFELIHPVRLHNSKERENLILAGVRLANHDQLKDLPEF